MKPWIVATLLLVFASAAFAEEAAPKTSTVGGGVANPWRPPYRTALTLPADHTPLHP
jgi:hypothetical protein